MLISGAWSQSTHTHTEVRAMLCALSERERLINAVFKPNRFDGLFEKLYEKWSLQSTPQSIENTIAFKYILINCLSHMSSKGLLMIRIGILCAL
jgi:hypothetical protein